MKILTLFLLFNYSAFAKKQLHEFNLTVFVNNDLEGKKIYLRYQYADFFGGLTIDSQYVFSNKAVFKGLIWQPATAHVYTSIKLPSQIISILPKELLVEFNEGKLDDAYELFLIPGKTTINAKKSFSEASISEQPDLLDFELLKKASLSRDSLLSILYPKMLSCLRKDNKECVDKLKLETEYESKKLRTIFFNYANTHPGSPIALYALKNSIPWNPDSPAVYLKTLSKFTSTLKKYPEAIAYKKLLEGALNFHIGMAVKSFDQADTAGNTVSFRSFKGRFVLIYFWNSSSFTGFSIHSDMLRLWEKYKGANFTIISIGLETIQSKTNWLKVIRAYNTPWVHLTDFKGLSNAVAQQFGVISLPFNLLINTESKIILKNGTINEIDQFLMQKLK